MKKLLLSAISLAALSGSAFAADLPSRKEPVIAPPPPPMWTGFYAGLNLGGAVSTSSNAFTSSSAFESPANIAAGIPTTGVALANMGNTSVSGAGLIGGGQVGYNYQWNQNFLVGLEADIQGSTVAGSGNRTGAGLDNWNYGGYYPFSRTTYATQNINANLNWFGTVRGRLGYLFTPTLLVYGMGGLTYGGVSANVRSDNYSNISSTAAGVAFNTNSMNTLGSASNTLVGWNAGGGAEWMFMPNWSAKVEAFYYNLGSLNVSSSAFQVTPSGAIGYTVANNTNISFNGVVARAGVNYHFNWGNAPVVAKF
jgi:outer membrane immunogenic protein